MILCLCAFAALFVARAYEIDANGQIHHEDGTLYDEVPLAATENVDFALPDAAAQAVLLYSDDGAPLNANRRAREQHARTAHDADASSLHLFSKRRKLLSASNAVSFLNAALNTTQFPPIAIGQSQFWYKLLKTSAPNVCHFGDDDDDHNVGRAELACNRCEARNAFATFSASSDPEALFDDDDDCVWISDWRDFAIIDNAKIQLGGGDDCLVIGPFDDSPPLGVTYRVRVEGGNGNDDIRVFSNVNVDYVAGGDGNDLIYISSATRDNTTGTQTVGDLYGNDGDDYIIVHGVGGTRGRNTTEQPLDGFALRVDSVQGGAGCDTLLLYGADRVKETLGGPDNDTVILSGIVGNETSDEELLPCGTYDIVTGEGGGDVLIVKDLLRAVASNGPPCVRALLGGEGDNYMSIEHAAVQNVTGGDERDWMLTCDATVRGAVRAYGGADVLHFQRSRFSESIEAGSGDDTLVAGPSAALPTARCVRNASFLRDGFEVLLDDVFAGGSGDDVIGMHGVGSHEGVYGGSGDDTIALTLGTLVHDLVAGDGTESDVCLVSGSRVNDDGDVVRTRVIHEPIGCVVQTAKKKK